LLRRSCPTVLLGDLCRAASSRGEIPGSGEGFTFATGGRSSQIAGSEGEKKLCLGKLGSLQNNFRGRECPLPTHPQPGNREIGVRAGRSWRILRRCRPPRTSTSPTRAPGWPDKESQVLKPQHAARSFASPPPSLPRRSAVWQPEMLASSSRPPAGSSRRSPVGSISPRKTPLRRDKPAGGDRCCHPGAGCQTSLQRDEPAGGGSNAAGSAFPRRGGVIGWRRLSVTGSAIGGLGGCCGGVVGGRWWCGSARPPAAAGRFSRIVCGDS
jgi:hypothetical protein